MVAKTVYVIFLLLFQAVWVIHGWTSTGEKDARTNTVKAATYDRLVRPSENVNLEVGLHLLAINFLEMKTQQLSVTGWISAKWEDSRLSWNTGTYDAETLFALDSEIWKPELFVDNTLDDISILNDEYLQFRVENNGEVEWELPKIFVTHCDIDIQYFPFDTQSCLIELTSWAYAVEELSITPLYTVVQTEEMSENGEWKIKSSSVSTRNFTEVKPGGAERSYSVIDFTIVMKRNPSHYITATILPILATSVLSVMVFLLPVDCGEKGGYTLTVLLAEAVLLTLVSDSMPSSSRNTSYLAVYLAVTLILGVLCVILSVLVIRVHFTSPNKPVPKWVDGFLCKFCIPVSCWRGCCCKSRKTTSGKVTPTNADTDTNDNYKFEDFPLDHIFAWTEVAAILDWFFFVLLSVITALVTTILIVIIIIGGLTA